MLGNSWVYLMVVLGELHQEEEMLSLSWIKSVICNYVQISRTVCWVGNSQDFTNVRAGPDIFWCCCS